MNTDSPLRWVRRQVFGMTQDELGDAVGVSRLRVHRYENGSSTAPYAYLKAIRDAAQRLGKAFNADWLFETPKGEPSACAAAAERVPGDVQ